MRCEDFPCCGHESGDCPDPDARSCGEWPLPCVECGGRIKHGEEQGNAPSMHERCADRYVRLIDEYGYDPREDDY
jgi:hypothetical protein